jgi:FkbM family methyltransferase
LSFQLDEVSMFDSNLGTREVVGGKNYVRTRRGANGCAMWAAMNRITPGRYCIVPDIRLPEGADLAPDHVCATVEVISHASISVIAAAAIRSAELENRAPLRIDFEVDAPVRVESRVLVHGAEPLLIDESPQPVRLTTDNSQDDEIIRRASFPDVIPGRAPAFLAQHSARLRQLHQQGVLVNVVGEDVVLDIDGVRIYARRPDDLFFVEEVYFSNTYNIWAADDICAIDIGMNVGLATLYLARKPNVKEVHSFEPFGETFERGVANIRLNPDLERKISTYNVGLSGKDEELTILLDHDYSGAFSTRSAHQGRPVQISVRDAATTLGPIIDRALAKGLEVVAKVDCEGSEFEVFDVLEASGYLAKLSALLVEWHRISGVKTQADLISPLLKHGFIVFDRTIRQEYGNGFFYAARLK